MQAPVLIARRPSIFFPPPAAKGLCWELIILKRLLHLFLRRGTPEPTRVSGFVTVLPLWELAGPTISPASIGLAIFWCTQLDPSLGPRLEAQDAPLNCLALNRLSQTFSAVWFSLRYREFRAVTYSKMPQFCGSLGIWWCHAWGKWIVQGSCRLWSSLILFTNFARIPWLLPTWIQPVEKHQNILYTSDRLRCLSEHSHSTSRSVQHNSESCLLHPKIGSRDVDSQCSPWPILDFSLFFLCLDVICFCFGFRRGKNGSQEAGRSLRQKVFYCLKVCYRQSEDVS